MSQLLDRSTMVIDALAASDLPITVHEVADRTALPVPTCGRILQDLVRLGWADQRRPRGPYCIGPRMQLLADRHPYRWQLIEAARPLVATCCRALGQSVILAGLRGTRRHILCLRTPGGDDQRDFEESDDLASTVGGRMLMAHLPAARLRRMLPAIGLPNQKRWRGLLTVAEIQAELAQYRRQGFAARQNRERQSVAMAFKTHEGEYVSLGTSAVRESFDDQSLAVLRDLSRKILARSKALLTS